MAGRQNSCLVGFILLACSSGPPDPPLPIEPPLDIPETLPAEDLDGSGGTSTSTSRCPVTAMSLEEYCADHSCWSVPAAEPRDCGYESVPFMSSTERWVGCGLYVETHCSDDVGTCITRYFDDATGGLLFVHDRRPNGELCYPVIEAGTKIDCWEREPDCDQGTIGLGGASP